jgi:hypothetical protein
LSSRSVGNLLRMSVPCEWREPRLSAKPDGCRL